MGRKRKAPASQQVQQQKPIIVREPVKEESSEEEEEIEEEEEVESEESSSSEEEESAEESEEEEEEEEEEVESSSEEDETDEATKRATLSELLEPFGKSQIIALLQEAAAKDPNLISKIVNKVESDPTHRNLFIYGLGWDATTDQVLQSFKPFGEIEDCKVITDKKTGRAKGYAFVLFRTRASARKALKLPQKKIGSRMVTCQLAATGPSSGTAAASAAEKSNLKIYIGNVGPQINPEKLKTFFRRYGEIEEGPIGLDPTTNKFKGFAVITYKTSEGYKKAMEEPIKVFENAQLHCKKYLENHNKGCGGTSTANPATSTPTASDVGYGNAGMNAPMLTPNLNAGGLFLGPNLGAGFPGNGMFAAGYNPAGLVASAGASVNYGMGNLGPTVMGNYGSQAALNGLGAFQSTQTGQSAVGSVATTTTATRLPASGAPTSSSMEFPSYFGH